MPEKVNRISAIEARKFFDENPDLLLIDVRQPEEYRQGHIPGAILMPLPDLPDRLMDIPIDRPIVTYCRTGRRSLAGAQLIADEKDVEVYSIDGGIMAWNGHVAKGDVEEGLKLIENLKTPEEFVNLAYCLEDGSKRFYQKMYEYLLSEDGVDVFDTLARAEEKHKKTILESSFKIDERCTDYMESGIKISDVINLITSNKMGIYEVLEYSMQMEINSLDLYLRILRSVDFASLTVFNKIISEEKRHLKMLGDLLSRYTERKDG